MLFILTDNLIRFAIGHARWRTIGVIGGAALLAAFSLFYLPQFVVYFESSATITYFGITQSAYLEGILPALPNWLDKATSTASLLGAKLMYVVGLRPTYGQTPDELILLRAAPSLLLLPGLIYGFLRADRSHQLLLLIFFLPIFLGATQDRYNLPVQPLLFWFGTIAYRELRTLTKRTWSRAIPRSA